MNITQLSEIFIASGVNKVNDNTFTALYHGYNLRGKIVVPSVPTVDFIFYGDIVPNIQSACDEFVPKLFEKYGRFPIKVGNNFFSVLLDLGVRDVAGVKSVLSDVTDFLMANNCAALVSLPPEPVEVSIPQPQEQNKTTQKKQIPSEPQMQPQQTSKPKPKPPEPEEMVPFANHVVLERVLKIFMLGINKISENSFTTLYHGYNVVGKMPSAAKGILDLTFYGESFGDINADFETFINHMTEKYGEMQLKNTAGSIGIIFDINGKADSDVKTILGEISGFMMKHSIVAINFPNTVPKGEPYDPNAANKPSVSNVLPPVTTQQRVPYSPAPVQTPQKGNDNFVGKFFKKFGKKP